MMQVGQRVELQISDPDGNFRRGELGTVIQNDRPDLFPYLVKLRDRKPWGRREYYFKIGELRRAV